MLLGEFSFGLFLPVIISLHMLWIVAHRGPKPGLTLALYTWATPCCSRILQHIKTLLWLMASVLTSLYLHHNGKESLMQHLTLVTSPRAVQPVFSILSVTNYCNYEHDFSHLLFFAPEFVLNFMHSPTETGLPKAQTSRLEQGFYRLPCWRWQDLHRQWCRRSVWTAVS